MKKLLFIALTVIGASAFADTTTKQDAVIAVANKSVTNYGLLRIEGLGGAFGKGLGQNQICGLAGQAYTGFQVFAAVGLTDNDVADLLKGLLQTGLTVEGIRSTLTTDLSDCGN